MKKDCAFQYAYRKWDIHIEQDTDLITLDEAKELYKKYLPDFIEKLQEARNPEMVIWIDMPNNYSYGKSLIYLDCNYETDGKRLWKTVKEYVPEIDDLSTQPQE